MQVMAIAPKATTIATDLRGFLCNIHRRERHADPSKEVSSAAAARTFLMTSHALWSRRFPRNVDKKQHRRSAPRRRRLLLESLEDRQLLAAFTAGNIVAYRVGTIPNPSALTFAATPVFLDEYTPGGALVQSIP